MKKHNGRYILDAQKRVIACPDLYQWGAWLENAQDLRRVGLSWVADGIKVSTVFIGLDMGILPGQPILWESMVFVEGDQEHKIHGHQLRCAGTWEQAEAMHEQMVAWAEEQLKGTNDSDDRRVLESGDDGGNAGGKAAPADGSPLRPDGGKGPDAIPGDDAARNGDAQ